MKKTFIIVAILFLCQGLNAQNNTEINSFESALMDYNIYKTKSKFIQLEQAVHHQNLEDINLIKTLYSKDFKNADQVYDLIQKIEKRELVLKSNDKKYKSLDSDELKTIKNDLSNFYYTVGKKFNTSQDKLDAIVSYKSLKKASDLNKNLKLEAELNKALANGQTKVYLSFANKNGSKAYIKTFKEILKNTNDDLIVLVDDKSKSDLEVKLDINKVNQQTYVTQYMRNGAVIDNVLHNSYEVDFNSTKGFGQVNTSNYSASLLDQFNVILKNDSKINYLELNNIISYTANVILPNKNIALNENLNDKFMLSAANIDSTVWSDISVSGEANSKLVLNDIYNKIKNEILMN